jgi:hypothetical protein
LLRREAGGIIRGVNNARNENTRQELTKKLQGILDRGIAQDERAYGKYGLIERRTAGEDIGHEGLRKGLRPGYPRTYQGGQGGEKVLDPAPLGILVEDLTKTVKGIKTVQSEARNLYLAIKSGDLERFRQYGIRPFQSTRPHADAVFRAEIHEKWAARDIPKTDNDVDRMDRNVEADILVHFDNETVSPPLPGMIPGWSQKGIQVLFHCLAIPFSLAVLFARRAFR